MTVSRLKNWGDDPGDFHVIDVKNNDKRILEIKDDMGWDYFCLSSDYKKNANKAFHEISLSANCKALVFTGITIMSQPPLVSIILINKGKATLVYNKPSYLNSITENAAKTIVLCLVVQSLAYYATSS